jgi:hypothetical protein
MLRPERMGPSLCRNTAHDTPLSISVGYVPLGNAQLAATYETVCLTKGNMSAFSVTQKFTRTQPSPASVRRTDIPPKTRCCRSSQIADASPRAIVSPHVLRCSTCVLIHLTYGFSGNHSRLGSNTAMTVNRKRKVIGVAAAVLLAACAGSIGIAGIQGSGHASFAVGQITRFGSVFVNGVEYFTSGAQILIDDQPGTEAQLHAGQIVTIKGRVNDDGVTGTATEVSFRGDVQGPATQIDPRDNTLVVLGQRVRVTGSTLFDEGVRPADLTGLQAGSFVEVSGFANAAGQIVASRVDLKSAGSHLQVKGAVEALDAAAHTFHINALIVDYGASPPSTTLANGSVVVVQGATLTSTGELLATRVEVLPGLAAAANQHADVEGIITSFMSVTDFALQGQNIATDAHTHFVLHGVSLGLNVEVDVKGTVNASGKLLARKVEVRPQSTSLVRGLVDSVTASSNTLSVLGMKVTTSAWTRFEDKSSQHMKLFGLTDLHAGDCVEVHGTEIQPGTLSAATLERDNVESRSYLPEDCATR